MRGSLGYDWLLNLSAMWGNARNNFVQHSVLPNGISLSSQPRFISKNLEFAIVVKSGAVNDPEGKEGTAHFLEHVLFDMQSHDEFTSRNGYLSLATNTDQILIEGSLKNTQENQNFLFAALRHILIDPVIEDRVLRERNRIHNEINRYNDMPEEFHMQLSGHSYSKGRSWSSVLGIPKSLYSINVEDLNKFKAEWFRGPNIFMAVTGINDHKTFHDICAEHFKDISGDKPPPAFHPEFVSVDFRQSADTVSQLYFATLFPVPPVSRYEKKIAYCASTYLSGALGNELMRLSGLAYHVEAVRALDTVRVGEINIKGDILPHLADQVIPKIAPVLAKAAYALDDEDVSRIRENIRHNHESSRKLWPCIPESAVSIASEMASYGKIQMNLVSEREFSRITTDEVQDFIRETVYARRPSIIAYGDSRKLHTLDEFIDMLEVERKKYASPQVLSPGIPPEIPKFIP